MKKGRGYQPTVDVFTVAFDSAPTEAGDFAQGPSESDRCNPLASIIPINEKAGDSPIRKADKTIEIGSLILDAGKLLCRPELTPADGGRGVVHKGSVRPTVPDSPFLLRTILQHGPVSESALEVKGHTPAATPYAVVLVDQPSKVRPRGFVQRLGVEACQNLFLILGNSGRVTLT